MPVYYWRMDLPQNHFLISPAININVLQSILVHIFNILKQTETLANINTIKLGVS